MPHLTLRRFATSVLSAAILMLVLSISALSQAEEIVVITDELKPSLLEVSVGTTVTWRNDDGERHRVRSREGPEEFDSGNLDTGETFSFTFAVEGDYPYLDHRNGDDPAYFGSVTVGISSGDGQAGPLPTKVQASMVDRSFRPASIHVATGGSIEWSNRDGEAHTVTAVDGSFDSGIVEEGGAFSVDFAEPGTYPYFCAIHPDVMRGTVTVSDPSADSVEAEPPVVTIEPEPEPIPDEAVVELAVGDVAVSIIDLSFQPARVTVEAGGSVAWSNDDSVGHTVTADEGAFRTGVLTLGEGFTFRFDEPGTFDYFCAIHPEMRGTVIVAASREAPSGSG